MLKVKGYFFLLLITVIILCKVNLTEFIGKVLTLLYPVMLAVFLAWFLIPAKIWVENQLSKTHKKFLIKNQNIISSLLVYLLFLSSIAFFIIYLIPIIKDGITSATQSLSSYYEIIKKYIDIEDITKLISPQIYIQGAKGTVSFLFKIATSLIILIYVIAEHRQLKKFSLTVNELLLGTEKSERLIYYFRKINTIFIKYFYSKLVSSLLLGGMVAIGFMILGISYPVFFGIVVAISNMIPVFGAFVSGIPIALSTFTEYGLSKAITTIIVIVAGQQIENNILTPKIVGNSIGLSGFWILFTVILGGGLFGFIGTLICIPVAATIKMFYEELLKDKFSE